MFGLHRHENRHSDPSTVIPAPEPESRIGDSGVMSGEIPDQVRRDNVVSGMTGENTRIPSFRGYEQGRVIADRISPTV